MLQTHALKIADAPPGALSTFGQGRLALGAGAYAVTAVSAGKDAGSYLVLTADCEHESQAYAAKLTKEIKQLPGSPRVEWA
eukprot:6374191-Alexandrium_andersonii.AAC.1